MAADVAAVDGDGPPPDVPVSVIEVYPLNPGLPARIEAPPGATSEPQGEEKNEGGRPLKFTPEEVIVAIRLAHGLASYAAELLRCDSDLIRRYVKRFPEVAEAQKTAREDTLDLGEHGLITALKAGEEWAIKFSLARLGKDRGYTERTQIQEVPPLSIVFEAEPEPGEGEADGV